MPPEGQLVGFVGRLSPEKGPEVFLRAAALLHEKLPEVHFLMIGDGPMLTDLTLQARKMGLRRHVHFVPATEDIASMYGELDVLAHCSHSEAMPLVLMEAMASGLPLVATHVGGVPEIVVPDVTGMLCWPGDYQQMAARLGDLLQDPARRARMGSAARRHAENSFSIDRTVDSLSQLFVSLAVKASAQQPAAAREPIAALAARA